MDIQKFEGFFNKELSAELFSAWQYTFLKNGATGTGFGGTYGSVDNEKISENTFFDIASLTKVVLTVPVIYYATFRKIISPGDNISKFFNGFNNNTTILSLLSHTSGLPAWFPYFDLVPSQFSISKRKERVKTMILESFTSNTQKCYSDLNYLLLGFILEKVFAQPLDSVFQKFLKDAKIDSQITFHPEYKTPFTAFSKTRRTFPAMTVEDENCYFLGGICGHAGLFASSTELVRYFDNILNSMWFSDIAKSVDYAGFDRPEGTDSNYGKKADNSFIGHLGFTGTAVLIDPEKKTVAALLTNSTHPDPGKPLRKERIKKCRQIFFDEVF